jgi:hypothetical protein
MRPRPMSIERRQGWQNLMVSDCQTTVLIREVEVNRLEGVVEANGSERLDDNR